MKLAIIEQWLLTGFADDTLEALMLPSIGKDLKVMEKANGETYLHALIDGLSSDTHLSRICSLLERAIADSNLANYNCPILWLLPELELVETGTTKRWFEYLQTHYAQLFKTKPIVFPYGRAALPIAMHSLEQIFQSQQCQQLCLVAIDTLYPFKCNDESSVEFLSSEVIPSEGVAIVLLEESRNGISLEFSSQEAGIQSDLTSRIESLFLKQKDHDNSLLQAIYLPGNGDERLVTAWLNAYEQLAGQVSIDTQLVQTGYATAELGAVTGLYNFMHLYDGFLHNHYHGHVLQLEVSDRVYSSVARYTWSAKES